MSLNQNDHGNANWWDMSEGWPQTTEDAYKKWVFANKSKIIPYGSYVIGTAGYAGITVDTLRVETVELLNILNENYVVVKSVILDTEKSSPKLRC